jgi:hypothetical protein
MPSTLSNIATQARGMVSGIVPDEYRQSLPIPGLQGDQVILDYLFLPTQRLPAGQELFPPKVCVRFTHDGQFVRALAIDANRLLPGHQPGVALGLANLLEKLTYNEYLERSERYLNLLSQWCHLRQQGNSAGFGRQQAQETLSLFQEISEAPLRDYYQNWGREFFQSLRQISQSMT